jgi:hypothetical protein
MTLHRAKGLQFDTVIIPGLRAGLRAATGRCSPAPPSAGTAAGADAAAGRRRRPVHAYLVGLDDREPMPSFRSPAVRGCTRAQRRLDLIGVAASGGRRGEPPSWRAPGAGTALAAVARAGRRLLPAPFGHAPSPARPRVPGTTGPAAPLLRRFPAGWSPPPPSATALPAAAVVALPRAPVPFDWAEAVARHVGVVAHRVYARIARDGLSHWDRARVAGQRRRLQQELAGKASTGPLWPPPGGAGSALGGVLAAKRGRWLFAPRTRPRPANGRWPGSIRRPRLVHVVIDRSFVADGVRWIVDFKTGSHEGGDRDAFLDAEVLRYRSQLERYGRLVRQLDPRPLRLALFYPRLDGWRAWDFAA